MSYLDRSEDGVDEAGHEGGVEAVLRRQARHAGVRDGLRDHRQPYCYTCTTNNNALPWGLGFFVKTLD